MYSNIIIISEDQRDFISMCLFYNHFPLYGGIPLALLANKQDFVFNFRFSRLHVYLL